MLSSANVLPQAMNESTSILSSGIFMPHMLLVITSYTAHAMFESPLTLCRPPVKPSWFGQRRAMIEMGGGVSVLPR